MRHELISRFRTEISATFLLIQLREGRCLSALPFFPENSRTIWREASTEAQRRRLDEAIRAERETRILCHGWVLDNNGKLLGMGSTLGRKKKSASVLEAVARGILEYGMRIQDILAR